MKAVEISLGTSPPKVGPKGELGQKIHERRREQVCRPPPVCLIVSGHAMRARRLAGIRCPGPSSRNVNREEAYVAQDSSFSNSRRICGFNRLGDGNIRAITRGSKRAYQTAISA